MSAGLRARRGYLRGLQTGRRMGATVLVLALLATGCIIGRSGPEVMTFGPAQSPHGVHTTISGWGSVFEGELLEVRDDGLLLLAAETRDQRQGPERLTLVTWEAMTSRTFRNYGVSWRAATAPGADARRSLALVSRYPIGLTAGQLTRLLAARGQDEVDRVPRPGWPGDPGEGHAHPQGGEGEAGAVSARGHDGDSDPVAEAFLVRTTEALARLGTVEAALLAGYRPLGPDFPGMGRHWVQPALLVRGGLDPTHPPFLTFLDTPSGTVLTGAAFGTFLAPGDAEPAFPFAGAWHAHTGTVDEETLKLGPTHTHRDGEGPRLTMLHAWLGLENPGGVFAQDNWAVPWARAGFPVPSSPSPAAGKALFLLSGGDAYYLDLIRRSTDPDPEVDAAASQILDQARDRVDALVGGAEALASGSTDTLVAPLEELWSSMWKDILHVVPSEAGLELLALLGR